MSSYSTLSHVAVSSRLRLLTARSRACMKPVDCPAAHAEARRRHSEDGGLPNTVLRGGAGNGARAGWPYGHELCRALCTPSGPTLRALLCGVKQLPCNATPILSASKKRTSLKASMVCYISWCEGRAAHSQREEHGSVCTQGKRAHLAVKIKSIESGVRTALHVSLGA